MLNPKPISARPAPARKPALPETPPATLPFGSGRNAAFDASLEFFLSPLGPFLRDPEVTEIMANGPEQIYIEKAGRLHRTEAKFASELDLQAAANNIAQFVGMPLSPQRPIIDGRLPDGSRVCIVLSPIAVAGTQINIRRFTRSAVRPDFLLENQSITPMAMEFLLLAVKLKQNILASGGSGSGKTTLLNVLTTGFGADERILVIEDTRELQVQREHVVQMEARAPDAYGRGEVSVRDLFVASLRMRPDRIVVGEVRRGEALDLIQAMTAGQRGTLATLHASSPADACHRLETMALMADVGIPLFALRRQVTSAIDLIVQTLRMPTGRRLITQISEIGFDEPSQSYAISDLFALRGAGEACRLEWTRARPRLADDPLMAQFAGDTVYLRELFAVEGGGG
jgi:pilus assembly protein CpaF